MKPTTPSCAGAALLFLRSGIKHAIDMVRPLAYLCQLTSVSSSGRRQRMTHRPVIGIAMQTQQPVAGRTPLCWIMGQRYIRALTAVGAVPWLIPLVWEDEATVRAVYEHLDGVF